MFKMGILLIVLIILLLAYLLVGNRYLRSHWGKLPVSNKESVGGIISLTTIPSRAGKITPTLRSLLDQTVPAHIYIHVPKRANCEPNAVYRFPSEIRNHPNITIVEHPNDHGPSMKFIPAIQTNKGKHIIVVDDDNIYPRTLVHDLLQASTRDPNKVHCTRGWRHSPDMKWENTKEIFSNQLTKEYPVSVITGCGGYVISPMISQKLSPVIADYQNVGKECRLMDDIWISGHLARLSIPKVIISNQSRYYPSISTFFTPDHLTPERARKNNVVIEHFKDSWKNDTFPVV